MVYAEQGASLRIGTRVASFIDRLNELVGHIVSWFVLFVILNVFAVVCLRYLFGIGHVWMQELYVWVHASAFMLSSAYTLMRDGHVRIDVIYRDAGEKYQNTVNLLGALFLGLPFMWVLFSKALPLVERSFERGERSSEAGGLPALWLLKGTILVFTVLVGLQLVSIILKSLRGRETFGVLALVLVFVLASVNLQPIPTFSSPVFQAMANFAPSAQAMAGLMFLCVLGFLLLGFPVALTLGGTALLFALLGAQLGLFPEVMLNIYPLRILGTMKAETLVAIPLFIFMGVMLEKSDIASNLLMSMGRLFGKMRGGLGLSVIFVGALLAAATGIVGATVVTMGLISLPAMLRAKYSPQLASGIICASGTLGQIIPPSIVLVLLGDIMQGVNEQAAEMKGVLVPEPVTAIDLFAGALLPGFILVLAYSAWVLIKALIDRDSCPSLIGNEAFLNNQNADQGKGMLSIILPPLFLIIAVLGSILSGFATPTESAAVGAVGAILLAFYAGKLSYIVVRDVSRSTTKITSMVFMILIGASMFSLVFRGFGGDGYVEQLLHALPGGPFGAMLIVMAILFFLGFFLDFLEIIFVVVPIVGPSLIAMGYSPLWLGVMFAINLQTSFLTPPFGFSLFYLRGVAPDSVRTLDIYKGVMPFIVIQLLVLTLLAFFPGIVTWLPQVLFSR